MPHILQWCVSICKYDVSHDGDGVLLFPMSLSIPRDGNSWDSELSTACSQAKVLSPLFPLKSNLAGLSFWCCDIYQGFARLMCLPTYPRYNVWWDLFHWFIKKHNCHCYVSDMVACCFPGSLPVSAHNGGLMTLVYWWGEPRTLVWTFCLTITHNGDQFPNLAVSGFGWLTYNFNLQHVFFKMLLFIMEIVPYGISSLKKW